MHIDHLTFVAGPQGLQATVDELSEVLGREFKDGGFHPRFGTRNNILPLTDGRYLEAVEVLDHPAADKAVANPPLTCEGVGAAMKSLGESCKACHQDFRG